jgi:sugar/nucleoside kinase (ribokinase family)
MRKHASGDAASASGALRYRANPAMTSDRPVFIFAGSVRKEYYLFPDGKTYAGLLGGPALSAAAGARPWTQEGIGLIARVGANFDARVFQEIRLHGMDASGIRIFPGLPPSIGFYYYESLEKHMDGDPVKYFTRHNLPCPQELMGYTPPARSELSIHPFPETAVRRDDIPEQYWQARAVGITPCHFQTQVTLSVAFRQNGVGTILLSPPESLMLPAFRRQIREILHGIDILFVREDSARAFVGERYPDGAAICAHLAQWGPKIILLQKGLQGIYAYDAESHKGRFVPFYPASMKDPHAIGDSFCGGFLVSWRKTFDPVESTLVGCVSASLAVEGPGALYALERNPGLAEARLTSLRRSLAA